MLLVIPPYHPMVESHWNSACIYIYIYTCISECMYIYIYIHVYIIYTFRYTCICMYVYLSIYTCTYAYIYISYIHKKTNIKMTWESFSGDYPKTCFIHIPMNYPLSWLTIALEQCPIFPAINLHWLRGFPHGPYQVATRSPGARFFFRGQGLTQALHLLEEMVLTFGCRVVELMVHTYKYLIIEGERERERERDRERERERFVYI